ncbi:hypothetical protein N9Z15_03390 [Akkermansiaceae bacterium]|nr:hypothetical protein [Akkermansiaceae bacterium]MDB4412683.1 hypothetical protein [bacterium]
MFGLVFQAGLLWFLITLFTKQTNNSHSRNEMTIILIGFIAAALLTDLVLGPILGIFTVAINVAINVVVLYILIDKVCGTSKKITIKICAWYAGITITVRIVITLVAAMLSES